MRNAAGLTTRDRLIIVAFGSAFLLPGLLVVAIGLHWVPLDARMHSPGWVVAVIGLVFVGAGAAIVTAPWAKNASFARVMGAVMFIGVTVVIHWVAFGPGPRQFTNEHRVNGRLLQVAPLDEQTGRRISAGVAIMLDLMGIAFIVYSAKKDRRRPPAPR